MPRTGDRLLTPEEHSTLRAMIKEAQSRGLDLQVQKVVSRTGRLKDPEFKKSINGYFFGPNWKLYTPNEAQRAFITSNARFVGIFSGRGGGKSAAGSQKALFKIERGLSGAVINPDFENFKVSTWPEFRDWIPWSEVVPAHQYRRQADWTPLQPFSLAFQNGAVVICKGLKDPDSARGPNINWLWYDEAGRDKTGLAWKIAIASVRVGEQPQAWVTTTPKGRLHWCHNFFVEQDIPEEALKAFADVETRPLVEYFTMTIMDNKDHLDPGYFASMIASYPQGWLRDQEIMGQFVEQSGILGNPAWFDGKVLDVPPDVVKSRIRYYDLAASEKKLSHKKADDPDETVGTLLSWDGELKFTIENQIHGHWMWEDIKNKIVETAMLDGPYVQIVIEQEPAAGGINQIEELKIYVKEKCGVSYKVVGKKPEGDKVMRANVWFAEAAQGRFFMVKGEWNKDFLDQLGGFPEAAHDDHVDSVSGARQIIAPFRTWKHIPFLSVGMKLDEDSPKISVV